MIDYIIVFQGKVKLLIYQFFHDFVYVRNQGYWPVVINICFVIFWKNAIRKGHTK